MWTIPLNLIGEGWGGGTATNLEGEEPEGRYAPRAFVSGEESVAMVSMCSWSWI
jgi:hypothetical protein